MTNGYSERDMQIWQEIGRHDERIKDLECDYQAMKDVLQKIYFARPVSRRGDCIADSAGHKPIRGG